MNSLIATSRTRLLLCFLLLIVLVIGVFSAVPGSDFSDWDDPVNVSNNPYYLPVTADNVLYFWRSAYHSLYMPVTYSLWAMAAAAGQIQTPLPRPDGGFNVMDPAPLHALSVLFHVANTILVFLVVRLLLERTMPKADEAWRDAAAFLGTCVFAVHPLQVEAVAWVTGFNNLSAGFFSLCCLLAYIPTIGENNRSTFLRRYIFATVFFVLALLSKPTAAAVPLVVAFIEIVVLRGEWRKSLLRMIPWILLTLAEVVVTLNASAGANKDIYLPIWGRPFIILDALAFYAGKLFYPTNMIVDYGRPPRWVLSSTWSYITGGIVLVALFLLSRLRDKNILNGIAITILATLPMLGVIPYYIQRYSTVADRYLYFGMIGISFAVATALLLVPERTRRLTTSIALAVTVIIALLGYQQTQYWRTTTALFTHVLEVNPRSNAAYTILGATKDRQERRDEANQLYLKALELRPNDSNALYNLGSNLGRSGKYQEALPYLQASVKYDSEDASKHNNLGLVWEYLGNHKEALSSYEAALRVSPTFAPAKNNRDRLMRKLSPQ